MKRIFFATIVWLFSYFHMSAQDIFLLDKGQFMEQVYGSNLLEEGKDLIEFNSGFLMAGWIENEYEYEEAEVTSSMESFTTSIDASLWFISSFTEELQHKAYGDVNFAEIAEAAGTDQGRIYLAIRKTQESNLHNNVSINDSLIVLGLDQNGIVQWTYSAGLEEGGIAPKDLIIDSDGNLVVLANSITGSGIQGSLIIKVSPLGTPLMRSNTYFGSSDKGATSYELVEYSNGYYYTICNDLGNKYPVSLLYDMFDPSNLIATGYPSLEDKHVFGFAYTAQKEIYAAGFSVVGHDTDAFVVHIGSNLGIANSINHGQVGTEKLNDIGQSVDGFIAGGVANNQGEGGWDNYILHFNSTATVVTLTETMGSEEDETSNHMRISKSDPRVYFPGMTLGFEERFGNASIMGTLSHPQGPVGSNCEFSRIAYVDDLIDFDSNGNVQGTKNTLSNKNKIINMAHTYNVDYVILYQIDRLFKQWADMNFHPYDQTSINNYTGADKPVLIAMNDLVTMLLEAHKDPNGIVFGMAVGGYQPFVDNSIDAINSIVNVLTNFNAHNAGKITTLVLEWEIWNLNSDFLLESLTIENNFRNSARVKGLFPGVANHQTNPNFYSMVVSSTIPNSAKQELISAYYHKLSNLRIDFLEDFKVERNRNANIKATMDYVAYLSSNTASVTTFYSSYNENNNSNAAGTVISEQQFKDNMASDILKTSKGDVDAVLLARYFDPGEDPIIDFNWGSGYITEDYETFASVPGENFNYIPLFSAEMSTGCKRGSNGFFGNWLGGSNTLAYAESQFTDQLWSSYGALWGSIRANCPTCYSKTKVQGFGWYLLNCIDENQISHQTTFTNFGLSNCNGTGSYFISLNEKYDTSSISIFPNPTTESFYLDFEADKNSNLEVQIYDLNGRKLLNQTVTSTNIEIKINMLPSGTYIVKIENQTFKLIKT